MNNITLWQRAQLLPVSLVAIMALTRSHHFGSAFALPDASLAVFFFAGLLCAKRWLLAGLLVEAGVIDYVAISQFSVSDFCISPAYLFLIPAYGVMWQGGKLSQGLSALNVVDSSKVFGIAVVAILTAYLLSNGSFYLLSDKVGHTSWQGYLSQALRYFPQYATSSLLYIAVGMVINKLYQLFPERRIIHD
jgi:hypothetical protein